MKTVEPLVDEFEGTLPFRLDPFQREYQLSFPILLPSQAVREGKTAFGQISTLPASFVFGRDGQLLSVFGGLPTAEELDRLIANAVKA